MGRHRNRVNGRGYDAQADQPTMETVEERLGLKDVVCTSCQQACDNAREPCPSCGGTQFRPKAREYRGKGSNNSGR